MKSIKIIKFVYLFALITIFFSFFCPLYSFAVVNPALVNRFSVAFVTIKNWLITISTPVAAVSIIIGFLMKKLSFGDEERIRIGKKLVRNAFVSYIFILIIDLIIDTIQYLTH